MDIFNELQIFFPRNSFIKNTKMKWFKYTFCCLLERRVSSLKRITSAFNICTFLLSIISIVCKHREATNESKTKVTKLITRDVYFLWSLSLSVHSVTVIRNQSANQSDMWFLQEENQFQWRLKIPLADLFHFGVNLRSKSNQSVGMQVVKKWSSSVTVSKTL